MSITESQLFSRTQDPVKQNQCFVLMPFAEVYREIYEDVIKPLVVELGFSCLRADELYGSRAIIQDIWHSIQTSGLVIADMTNRNPNVFYELGLAHAIGKNVILITQNMDDVPFDLRHLRCIVYDHTLRGAIKLKDQLRKTITNDPYIYSRIPVDILTDLFIGGFLATSIDFSVEFTGRRGKVTEITESYSIVAEHDNLHQFYKKVQTAGRLISAEGKNVAVDLKQLFVGMYLLSINFPMALSIGGTHTFSIKYNLEDNFPDENEYWFYNAEVAVEHIQGRFVFPRDAGVRDFAVYKRGEKGEEMVAKQPKSSVDGYHQVFEWSINSIVPPDCFVFRWKWR